MKYAKLELHSTKRNENEKEKEKEKLSKEEELFECNT